MIQPLVNVSIHNAPKIDFEVYGEYVSGSQLIRLKGKYCAFIEGEYIIIEGESTRFRVHNKVVLNPVDFNTDSFLLHNVSIGKKFQWERKKKFRYEGSLKFIIDGKLIAAINKLPIENYLVSVISSEMSSKSSLEFLKAHAIISRGWVLKQLSFKEDESLKYGYSTILVDTEEELIKWYNHDDHKIFDVCSDDHCQRYLGLTAIINDQAKKAVKYTRGMVLMHDNKLCDTRYSKCCGGKTELYSNVWENVDFDYLTSKYDYKYPPDEFDHDLSKNKVAEQWIRSRPEAFCNTDDNEILDQVLVDFDLETTDFYRWKVEYTQDELRNIIEEKSGLKFGDILSIRPVERGNSGRIVSLMVIGTSRIKIFGKELEIRRILSKSHLNSSAFYVEKKELKNDVPQKFIIHGAGRGHGVGFCQIGAAVMSSKGYKFDEILFHYFNDVAIKRAY